MSITVWTTVVLSLFSSIATATKSCSTTLMVDGLVMNCVSCGLREVPYEVGRNTTELLLNSNFLHTIGQHDLDELVNLTSLDLSQNLISSLHPLCFRGLFKLERLNLNHNHFPAMGYIVFPRGIFQDLISLRVLTATGYYVTYDGHYPVESLLDLISMEVLSLPAITNMIIPARFTELTKLRVLDFFAGNLHTITRQMIDGIRTSAIESIGFRNMISLKTIEDSAFSNFSNLRTMNLACCKALSHNYVVASLGQTINTSLDTIILDGISADGVFGHFRSDNFCAEFWVNVRRLSLRKNSIVSININKWCMKRLSHLTLSYNMPVFFHTPNKSRDQDYSMVPEIRVLDISYIPVTGRYFRDRHCDSAQAAQAYDPDGYFPSSPPSFNNKPVVRKMYKTDHQGYQHFRVLMPSLQRVYVRFWRSTLLGITSTQMPVVVWGADNVSYINVSNSMVVKSINTTIYGLSSLQIADMSYGILEYISPFLFDDFPNLRFLNLSHNSFGTSGTDFRAAFSALFELEDIDLSDNHIQELHVSVFINCTKVRNINLRNNVLQNVNLDLANMTQLELLDLSGNHITTLEEPFLSTIDALREKLDYRINLTGNPFACNCRPIQFVRWIQTTHVSIIDRENLTCTYDGVESRIRSIVLVDYEENCRKNNALEFVIGSLCVCLVIFVVVVFLVRYHRWYITYHFTMCYARGRCAASDDEDHSCDAMVIYFAYANSEAHWEASKWINNWVSTTLQPRAEKQWGLQLYIGGRDDKAGATKTENFLYGFSISDKVVVCLTESLSNDAQLGNHFNLALASKKPLSNYIFIIFDEARMDTYNKVIQRLLEPSSPAMHLHWVEGGSKYEQDKFWKTLKYALMKDSKIGICTGVSM